MFQKKTLGASVVVFLICLGVAYLLSAPSKGFPVYKIASKLEFNDEWVVDAPSENERKELKEILSQQFHFLGSGAQCYAFISADNKYVLKFFKMKHLLPKEWLRYLPLPGLEQYRFRKVDKRIFRQKELFGSYKMAFQMLRKETGLVFVHLNKTSDLNAFATVYDCHGEKSRLNLDRFEFVLQKKSQLVQERIAELMKAGHPEKAKEAINALMQHVVNQCRQGFIDRDSGVSHNYGFVGDEVIHFDVGRIVRDENAKKPSHYQREILRISKKLEPWLIDNYPELIDALDESVANIIQDG